jgi:hypothetical protein
MICYFPPNPLNRIEESVGMNEQELTDLFVRLGARNPAQWAHSEITEGIPQLARFLFLRQAWKHVVPEADRNWIRDLASVDGNGPEGDVGAALGRLTVQGVDENDLTTVVRAMQRKLLFALCYLLDDSGTLEPEVRDIAWRLFQVDDNERPIALIASLHESVLETKPNGCEMRS